MTTKLTKSFHVSTKRERHSKNINSDGTVHIILKNNSHRYDIQQVKRSSASRNPIYLPFVFDHVRTRCIKLHRHACGFIDHLSRCVPARAVVSQFYVTEAENEYVIRANSAIMKCKIPSFVSEFVQVDQWVANDGTVYTVGEDYGRRCRSLVAAALTNEPERRCASVSGPLPPSGTNFNVSFPFPRQNERNEFRWDGRVSGQDASTTIPTVATLLPPSEQKPISYLGATFTRTCGTSIGKLITGGTRRGGGRSRCRNSSV